MGGTNTASDGLGAYFVDGNVHFGVWAPFADEAWVSGDFNGWSEASTPLARRDDGTWHADISNAQVGQEYCFIIRRGEQRLTRNDPRALLLTSSGDTSVLVDSRFDWGDDAYTLPPVRDLVLYELHVGTFARDDPAMPGTFQAAMRKLDHLAELGINVVEIMPCNAVWMDRWWGYTPDNIYAVEAAYGGRRALQEFVRAAHQRGIGVLLDVVYNHLSHDPGLDLWQFDGWSENGLGGIYFYNDDRAKTPWGECRPDYGRPEVRKFITDNAAMLVRDFHVDGLRVDATLFIRNTVGKNNDPEHDLPDGWRLLQEINNAVRQTKPGALTIAEDLQGNDWITKSSPDGGAGFGAQWDSSLGVILREVLDPIADEWRDLSKLRFALTTRTNGDPFQRVIFTESHDTAATANGGSRLDESIEPGNAGGLFARKRAALAMALCMTAPGTPMLFQGQEFQEGGGFTHYAPLDWENAEKFKGVLQLHHDLIALRRNAYGNTAGLLGANVDVFHQDDQAKVLGYHRWDKAGARDDVVIVANVSNIEQRRYQLAFPAPGKWWVRFNTDWKGYSPDFTNLTISSVDVRPDPKDPQRFVGSIDIAPYAVLIFSQDK